jgi:hypothetical protein
MNKDFEESLHRIAFLHCSALPIKRLIFPCQLFPHHHSNQISPFTTQDAILIPFHLRNSDGSRSAGLVTLGGHNLVVVGTQAQAQLLPSIEVVGSSNSSGGSLAGTHGPVLLEGRGTEDRRLVGTGGGEDVVGGAVAGDTADLLGGARWVVGAEVFDDVVLDEGVGGPAVDGKVGVSVWLVGTGVVDVASRSWVPSLSCNEVTPVAGPGDAVLTSGSVVVAHTSGAISPEGVVVSVVGTSGAGSQAALEDVLILACWCACWCSKDTCDSRDCEEKRRCRNHDECWIVVW